MRIMNDSDGNPKNMINKSGIILYSQPSSYTVISKKLTSHGHTMLL